MPKLLTRIFVTAVGVFLLVQALTAHETIWAVLLGVALVVSVPLSVVDTWRDARRGGRLKRE